MVEGARSWNLRSEKVYTRGEMAFGDAGEFALGELLRWQSDEPDPPKQGVDRWLRVHWANGLRETAKKYHVEISEDSEALIGVRGKLFILQPDMTLVDSLPMPGRVKGRCVMAVGCGAPFALASIYENRDSEMTSEQLVEAALANAEYHCRGAVSQPWRKVRV